jgi:putative membrane protein
MQQSAMIARDFWLFNRAVCLALFNWKAEKMRMLKKIVLWLIPFFKGMLIGSSFILPGVSGGSFVVAFGIYERFVNFFTNIKRNFINNIVYFMPIIIGGIVGIFILSIFLDHFFYIAQIPLTWLFIGLIFGTLPSLWKKAGQHGRKRVHFIGFSISLIASLVLLYTINNFVDDGLPQNTYTWLMAGSIIGLGSLIPGFSSANILLFFQLYAPILNAIRNIDYSVIALIAVGTVITVFAFSKLMAYALRKIYSMLFHSIIGIVIASTLLIVPLDFNYISIDGLICANAVIIGILIAHWICKLEVKVND